MDINLGQIILQALNFGLLLFLLTKFLYRPIVKTMTDRTDKIAAGVKAAEDSIVEREKLAAQKQQALTSAQAQAAAVLDQARQEAEQAGKDIVAQAQAAAQTQAQKQYQLIQEKITKERLELKRSVSDLVVKATQAVLKDSLTPTHQKTIIDHQISNLKHLKTSS